ncbi:hypothetical protein [Deinococcus puniceus]|uniref:Uncharacterized protein n=1 Tax=Deinococcus puniceus TaxID=1182568 RepID=A0A172T7U7_9DEIO|nr:hypothetical protein [Deinococcus puniceus]ANE43115.1 hypothetical protein SU48_04290 [Deinococcus puniceus]
MIRLVALVVWLMLSYAAAQPLTRTVPSNLFYNTISPERHSTICQAAIATTLDTTLTDDQRDARFKREGGYSLPIFKDKNITVYLKTPEIGAYISCAGEARRVQKIGAPLSSIGPLQIVDVDFYVIGEAESYFDATFPRLELVFLDSRKSEIIRLKYRAGGADPRALLNSNDEVTSWRVNSFYRFTYYREPDQYVEQFAKAMYLRVELQYEDVNKFIDLRVLRR